MRRKRIITFSPHDLLELVKKYYNSKKPTAINSVITDSVDFCVFYRIVKE